MPVPMIDLKRQYATLKAEMDGAVLAVMESQQFRNGPAVLELENEIAAYMGVKHALGVATGTDALLLAFKALGLEPGDEIITTPFTFFATAGAIVNAGAVPVFADIDPRSFNIDPASIESRITARTRAIVPVHLFGQCAEMDAILALAERHNLKVIEDTAQALGARYQGRAAGSMGLASTLSFYPTKNLGTAGEGGMIATSDDAFADLVKLLRCHGSTEQYYHQLVGTNSHLQGLQAAVLRVKLPHLDTWNARRREVAAYYDHHFADCEDIVTPYAAPDGEHVYHQYVIRIPRRDEALAAFKANGIGCGVFYPKPLHLQDCFRGVANAAHPCPEAERASAEVLALPIFAEITQSEQDEVIAAVKAHLTGE